MILKPPFLPIVQGILEASERCRQAMCLNTHILTLSHCGELL